MPIYEYQCQACGHRMEVLQKITERPLRKCEKCSGRLEKLFSRTSFQLKGSGWYAQGYGNSSKKDSPSGADKSASSESKKSGAKDSDDSSKKGSAPAAAAAAAGD